MMFEQDRSMTPRAYTALAAEGTEGAEDDLLKAIEWCFDQADGDFARIGIQAASKDVLEDVCPLLAELAQHGASLHFDSRGKINSLPSGPVLVYQPQPSHLWQLEERPGPSAIAAVGIVGPEHYLRIPASGRPVSAQAWVSAYRPEHLGGPAIEAKDPVVPDPVVWAALKTFTVLINSSTGLAHSSDHSSVVDGLTRLRSAGHDFDPEDLLAGALALNWRGSAALELLELAKEINAGKRKRYRVSLAEDILQQWEDEARQS